jgi:hypothetical protein
LERPKVAFDEDQHSPGENVWFRAIALIELRSDGTVLRAVPFYTPRRLRSYAGEPRTDIAIILTTKVLKSGNDISGGIKQIVIVHHDGGYCPNPGHDGNGTVTSIFCTAP